MKQKNIFLDQTFLVAIWPNIWGLLYQNIATILILVLSWGINYTSTTVLEELMSRAKPLLNFTIIFSILAVIIFGFRFVARPNPLLVSIIPVSDLRRVRKDITNIYRGEDKYFKFIPLVVTLLIGVFVLLINYISGSGWSEATLIAVLVMLPFHLGFLTIHIVLVALEMLLLFLRYVIHS